MGQEGVSPTITDSVELLRSAIQASGLSARKYAVKVLLRDERTIRRWLAGDTPIPPAVVTFLETQVPAERRDGERRKTERRTKKDAA